MCKTVAKTKKGEFDMNKLKYFLWWMAGADKGNMELSSSHAQMINTALGVVFLVNFIILVMIWSKVGFHYFGLGGLILGLAIPCGFILGMDRIISMCHRPHNGVLNIHGIKEKKTSHTVLSVRLLMSVFLCLASTFTFQLQQSHSLIVAKSAEYAKKANQPLRQEFVERISSKYKQQQRFISLQEESLNKNLLTVLNTQRINTTLENEALVKAGAAREEEFSEIGGLGSRAVGDGVRANAQRAIANHYEEIAADAGHHKEVATREISQIRSDLKDLQLQAMESETNQRQLFEGINLQMKSDSRYVAVQSGLFSDATIFFGFFSDPEVAYGIWITSFIIFGFLLVLELLALISLSQRLSTSYDVAVHATEIKTVNSIRNRLKETFLPLDIRLKVVDLKKSSKSRSTLDDDNNSKDDKEDVA